MKRISAKEQIAAAQPGPEEKKSKKEKRRERKTGPIAEPPVQQPPAELPLAVAQEPSAPEAEMVEVAPLVEPEDYKPAQHVDISPAGEIGTGASVDKIVEPAEAAETSDTGSNAESPEGEDNGSAKPKTPRKSGTRRTPPAKPNASEPNES